MSVTDATQKELALVSIGFKAKPSFDDPTRQDVNRAGEPKWRVTATNKDGEVFDVTVTGPKPELVLYQPVWFVGLVVGGSKNGLWWAAKSVRTLGAKDA